MEETDVWDSSVKDVSGEWWVRYTLNGVEQKGYVKLITSNTAADDGKSIWIDDQGKFWTYKVKCPVNMNSMTFSGDQLISAAISNGSLYDIGVTVADGKVIKKGGFSTSGVVTDSIYFKVSFEDDVDENGDPAPYSNIYEVSGVRRTGFVEDEH